MGFLGNLKKELYINQLVSSYRLFYGCGDMAALECMRNNYSAKELKGILDQLKKAVGGKVITGFELEAISPFKEKPTEVAKIDTKHGGR